MTEPSADSNATPPSPEPDLYVEYDVAVPQVDYFEKSLEPDVRDQEQVRGD